MFGLAGIIRSGGQQPTSKEIVIHTTSSSASWTPVSITNSGQALVWSCSGAVTIAGQEYPGDKPTFDFSSNTGNATIIITVKSESDFVGLTEFQVNGTGLTQADNITFIDVTQATGLLIFSAKGHPNLSSIDVSTLVDVQNITVRTNPSLTSLDISNNVDLLELYAYQCGLTSIDLSANTLVNNVYLQENNIGSTALDAIVNTLDINGQINGTLNIENNTGTLTSSAYAGYQNLLSKGWTIVGTAPPAPSIPVSGLDPILSNFQIQNNNPDRIYFDSSEPLISMNLTGFTVSGKSFFNSNSVVINSGGTTGHYFIMASSFTYWDKAVTVRLEGGVGDIKDFTLQKVTNNIIEPATGAIKYVEVGGTGTGNNQFHRA